MIAALRLVRWQPTFGWCQPGGNLWNILDSSSDSQFSSGCRTSSTQNGVKWRSAEKFTQGDLLQLRLGLKPGVGQLTDWIRSVALLVVSIHVLGIGSRESFHPKWHVFHAWTILEPDWKKVYRLDTCKVQVNYIVWVFAVCSFHGDIYIYIMYVV